MTNVDPRRYWVRRLIVLVAVCASVTMIVRAYGDPYKVFGFQMFPESSSWQASVYRITTDGERIDVRSPWPGGYVWSDLVATRGLGAPNAEQHAAYGIDATLGLLQHALDYVAEHTPDDGETVRLEADIVFRRNAGPRQELVLSSVRRTRSP